MTLLPAKALAKPRRLSSLIVAAVACLISASCTTRAQSPTVNTDAANILKQAATRYQDLQSYQARITLSTVENTNTSEEHFTEIGSANAFRVESDDPTGLLRIDDGHTQWMVDRKANTYTKLASATAQPSYVGELATLDQHVSDIEILREDLFTVGDETRKVWILELKRDRWPVGTISGAQFVTVRVDEKTFEIYGENIYTNGPTQMIQVSIVRRNQNLPATLFAFTPAAFAHEVNAVSADEEGAITSSVLGAEAPDFTLADSAGHSYHLKDLRGKIVVIDFWASWCEPCRLSMPYIQQIATLYGDRGVEVLGLDAGEDAKTVADFAASTKFTFPLLIGAEPSVTAKYFVDAYPTTLLVDRDGRIAFRESGTDGPRPLVTAVQAALANKN